ncbi:MAG: hypothetical protein MZV64_19915 [Ignavibacteriales bacterium]|nr:hypothetical protein [Ignavibacteriales bacterium]
MPCMPHGLRADRALRMPVVWQAVHELEAQLKRGRGGHRAALDRYSQLLAARMFTITD